MNAENWYETTTQIKGGIQDYLKQLDCSIKAQSDEVEVALGMITAISSSFTIPLPPTPQVKWLPCHPPSAEITKLLWGKLAWVPDPAALFYIVYVQSVDPTDAKLICLGTTGGKSFGEFSITGLACSKFYVRWVDRSGRLQDWDRMTTLDVAL